MIDVALTLDSLFADMTMSEVGYTVLGCQAVMSLQFTDIRSFYRGVRFQNLQVDCLCSVISLYFVTITWQQICKDLLHVMVERISPCDC